MPADIEENALHAFRTLAPDDQLWLAGALADPATAEKFLVNLSMTAATSAHDAGISDTEIGERLHLPPGYETTPKWWDRYRSGEFDTGTT
jgi:hypothetical protein